MYVDYRMISAKCRLLILCALLVLLFGCSSENRDWSTAQRENTAASYHSFLQKFPSGKHSAEAQQRIESLDWQSTETADTPGAFRKFLKEHPSGSHSKLAIESLDWHNAETTDTPGAFRKFLKEHPSGTHAKLATAQLETVSWEAAKKTNTATSFKAYLADFPQGQFATEAKARVKALTPIRGKLSAWHSVGALMGGQDQVTYALDVGKKEYELEFSSHTHFINVKKEGNNVYFHLGQTYDVSGPVEKGSHLGGSLGTIHVTRLRYVGK